ncbi:RraA family protein [Herbaspirillum rhizosphaerae]|uniref:RraA family protein n=1 Tax=Herbaspirillum rhizosphaerae TaxID=346179 RepID=UPI00067E211C|nr:diguanylate cyclase [Herbaspirillum rhizosphaerae]
MSKSILDRLASVDTNSVSDALDILGLAGATYGLWPLWGCGKIVGRASTIQLAAKTAAKQTAHVISPVIETIVTEDRVLVIAGGLHGVSSWGDILANAAEFRQVRASVIDGMCRDIDGSEQIAYPVFGRGVTMISGRNRAMQISAGAPVMMAGVEVSEDDYVIADRCGTAFIAAERVTEVVALAETILAEQDKIIQAIGDGVPLSQLMKTGEFKKVAAYP